VKGSALPHETKAVLGLFRL